MEQNALAESPMLSRNGKWLATICVMTRPVHTADVVVWNTENSSSDIVARFTGDVSFRQLAWNSTGKHLAVAGGHNVAILRWHAATMKFDAAPTTILLHASIVHCVAWDPTMPQRIAFGDINGNLSIRDIRLGPRHRGQHLGALRLRATVHLGISRSAACCLAWAPNGKLLACGGKNGAVYVCRIPRGKDHDDDNNDDNDDDEESDDGDGVGDDNNDGNDGVGYAENNDNNNDGVVHDDGGVMENDEDNNADDNNDGNNDGDGDGDGDNNNNNNNNNNNDDDDNDNEADDDNNVVGTFEWIELQHHSDEVIQIQWSEDSLYMVSAATDGTLRVWDMSIIDHYGKGAVFNFR